MKISVERLKQIIKEELEAHTLSEQSVLDQPIGLGKRERVPVEPLNLKQFDQSEKDKEEEEPEKVDVVDKLILPKSWKQQQQMAKKGKVFVRKGQGYFHLTYLLRLAAPAYKKDVNPNSRKSRSLVAKMVRKMQNGSATLKTRKDYGGVVNLLDGVFMDKAQAGSARDKDINYNRMLGDPRYLDKNNAANAYRLYVKAAKNRIKHGYPGWLPMNDAMFLNPSHKYFGLTTFEMHRAKKTSIKGQPFKAYPERDAPDRDYAWWPLLTKMSQKQAKQFMRTWLDSYAKETGVPLPFDVNSDVGRADPVKASGAAIERETKASDLRLRDPDGKPISRFRSKDEKRRYRIARQIYPNMRPKNLMALVKRSLQGQGANMEDGMALRMIGGAPGRAR